MITVSHRHEQVKIVDVGEATSWIHFHKSAVHWKKLIKWNLHLTRGIREWGLIATRRVA